MPGLVARLDLEGAQAIQTEELIFEEEVDYVLSIGEEKIALQPKALQDQQVKDLIIVRRGAWEIIGVCNHWTIGLSFFHSFTSNYFNYWL